MAIARVYSSGWGFGEMLTSAQFNAIDVNSTYMIDKQPGANDKVGASIQATGAGRVVSTVGTGPDADTTFHVSGHNAIVRIPTLTAARTYTLGHSGATGGDRIFFYVEGTGHSPSGYAQIVANNGTGIFRLGPNPGEPVATAIPFAHASVEGDACEVMFVATGWRLIHGAGPGFRGREFTATLPTVWVCPPGVFAVTLDGWGGGGGGAGGDRAYSASSVSTTLNNSYTIGGGGGAGGGGSWPQRVRVAVVPGRAYEALAGGPGAGGLPGLASGPERDACPGGNGGDSIFREKASGNVLATFRGAEGGTPPRTRTMELLGFDPAATGVDGYVATGYPLDLGFGGRPVRPTVTGVGTFGVTMLAPYALMRSSTTGIAGNTLTMVAALPVPHFLLASYLEPGAGGFGTTEWSKTIVPNALSGVASISGYPGGLCGTGGSQSALYLGGGPGGGGGGGAGGAGATGGNGGGYMLNGSGLPSTIGLAAAAGSGGGGGGGGGASNVGTVSANADGKHGGPGGSGKIILTF